MVIQSYLVILTWTLEYPDLKGHSFKQKNSMKAMLSHCYTFKSTKAQHLYTTYIHFGNLIAL